MLLTFLFYLNIITPFIDSHKVLLAWQILINALLAFEMFQNGIFSSLISSRYFFLFAIISSGSLISTISLAIYLNKSTYS